MNTTAFEWVNATDLAKHFRGRLKHYGIPARCRVWPGTNNAIQVFVPKFGLKFTEEEQRQIRLIALSLRLTRIEGMPIDLDRMTDPTEMVFLLPARS